MPNSFFTFEVLPEQLLAEMKAQAEWVGLRFVRETTSHHMVRNDHPENNTTSIDEGVMVEVLLDGHFGYSGTADLSRQGILNAFEKALATTRAASRHKVFSFTKAQRPKATGKYISPRTKNLSDTGLAEITECLMTASQAMKISDLIINRAAHAMVIQTEIALFSTNGSDAQQSFDMVEFQISATASENGDSQTRTYSRTGQWGGEIFDLAVFKKEAERTAREAIELVKAENCPEGRMDLILMPDQMMLQIHESIGHPLELDRILGDERNYAGWSFVKPEDFGTLKYGSEIMNVTFDPTRRGEFASYAYDDGGNVATREYLIKDGILTRGLGSLESQVRSGLKGVANFRSASWARAPIDRMANINLEPGNSLLKDMIRQVERGVLMTVNRSWSIDDYRNKFQFGCEYGLYIENGEVVKTVKNPNYRGTTVDFWNHLTAVGSALEMEAFGTPYCGKGEPSQVIRVGHAAPPCLFSKIEVFGGHA